MKLLLILLFTWRTMTVEFTSTSETGVMNYVIQKSSDSVTWVNIATVQPGAATYSITISRGTGYYRIRTNVQGGYLYTKIIHVL